MTTEKGARAVGILRQGAGIRQVIRFSRKCLQIPVSCLQMSQFTINQTELFRKLSSICVFRYFPFGFEGRIWDLIVSVPDHCLSFYSSFSSRQSFRTSAFRDWWPIQTGNVIDTYCCSIPTVLALSAVVIRCMMMKMLSVFLFSEAFSK